jgi:hypothetical protein
MSTRRLSVVLTAAVVALIAQSAAAAGLTIAWDPNAETDIAGYVLKYGEQSRDYHVTLDAGRATTLTVEGLVAGRPYYFSVLAYAADGSTSVLAPELLAVATGTPAPLAGTARFTMAVDAEGRLATPLLRWSPAAGADAYQLRVGSSAGGADVVDTGALPTDSFTLPALPFDRTYYARIFTQQAGLWSFDAIAFKMPKTGGLARMLAPLDGASGVTSAQSFRWEAITQAEAYRFEIGTRSGVSDVVQSGETLRTAWTVASLPADTRLYARVSTKLAGYWYTHTIEFVSAPTAVFVYPSAGGSDISSAETFAWTAVTDAQAYRLEVGTAPGASDLVASGETRATTFPVEGLQPGQTLYARVSTRIKGVWQVNAMTFTTGFAARLTRPAAGNGADLGVGLAWTTILGAEGYALRLGTSAGAADLLDTGDLLGTELETPALPAGVEIFAHLSTRHGGEWRHADTSFTLAGAALTPTATLTGGAAGQLLTWTTISNAEAYRLYVGTTPGAQDLASSGEIQGTSFLVQTLPGGPAYVSLWTKADGLWNGTAATIAAR